MYIHRSLSASIGKRQQFFHWKTLGARGGIADSATVEGNFRVPATRQATNKMADAMFSGRNSTISQLSQCYTAVLTVRLYDPIRFYTTKIDRQLFLYDEIFTSLLRDDRMKNRRDRRFFRFPRVHRVHIGFLLRTIFANEMNGKIVVPGNSNLFRRNGWH